MMVGALLAIKFVVIPTFEWQNAKLADIHSLTKRLKKADALIENYAYLNQVNEQLTASLEQQKQLFFQGGDPNQTQLQQLREIESLIRENDIKIANSRWLGSQQKQGYTEHRLEVGITGDLVNVIQLISDVERQKRPRRFDSWNLSIRGMSDTKIGKVQNGKLVIQILVQDQPQGGQDASDV
jgi:hypothetical protein